MFTHRYHLPYYQQVAVFFWPILFFELWRIDRWQDETGRRAFVIPDKYGRAWVPWFEGMSQKPHLNGMAMSAYKPDDVSALCHGWLDAALSPSADATASWGPGTSVSHRALGMFMPRTQATRSSWAQRCAGVGEELVHLDPG